MLKKLKAFTICEVIIFSLLPTSLFGFLTQGLASGEENFIQPSSDAGGYYSWLGGKNKNHLGHDYNAPVGTEVKAIADGVVHEIVKRPARCYDIKTGYELSQPFVWIKHRLDAGRYFYALYGHIEPLEKVKKDVQITAGERIGKIKECYVWDRGKLVPAPHLHFGIWDSESPPPTERLGYGSIRSFTDPKKFLKENKPYEAGSFFIVAGEPYFTYTEKEIETLIPTVVFSNRRYISAWEVLTKDHPLKQKVLGIDKFWLYNEGNLIGHFKVSGFEPESEKNHPVLKGRIFWKSKPPAELSTIEGKTVALSHQIPQPFYQERPTLDQKQKTKINRIIEETLTRAKKIFARKYRGSLQLIGEFPRSRSLNTFFLHPDGPQIAYANVLWYGKPCENVSASVLSIWDQGKGRWKALRISASMSECPKGLVLGDLDFHVSSILDIDGNGIAELVINEGQWEAWNKSLYKIRNGKLFKLVDIGDYGS